MGMIKIAAAGILALPSLLVLVVTAPIVALLSLPSLALLKFQASEAPSAAVNNDESDKDTQEQHAIISGGSSGIGLSIAHDCIKRGMAKVTILARNKAKLEKAVKELESTKATCKASTIISLRSVDVSNAASLESTAQELLLSNNKNDKTKESKKSSATIYLFCCAGQAHPGYFEHVSSAIFAQFTEINQLGAIYTVQAFLPLMTKGTIVLTSSMAGQLGVYGYTAYSPTKFALRGFAEVLHAELSDQPEIHIQVAFPPDTDTPGFQEEEKIKPHETRLVSENAGLAKAEDIAHEMVSAASGSNPTFLVYFSFEGWMLSALTSGMSPVSSLGDAVTQVALNGLFRFISLFYLNDFWRIIRNCAQERLDKGEEKKRPGESSITETTSSENAKQD